jgi:hypothetical protein
MPQLPRCLVSRDEAELALHAIKQGLGGASGGLWVSGIDALHVHIYFMKIFPLHNRKPCANTMPLFLVSSRVDQTTIARRCFGPTTPKPIDPRWLRSIRPTSAGAASSFLVYRYSNGGECGFQFFALPFRHEMSRLGTPADVARQVFHPRCSEKVQIKPENFIGHDD